MSLALAGTFALRRLLCREIALLPLVLLLGVSSSSGWMLTEGAEQRSVVTEGRAVVGEISVPAFLKITRNLSGRPGIWMEFTISEAARVGKVFDLEPFEGPDAPALHQPWARLEIVGDAATKPLVTRASGWFSGDRPDAFSFGLTGEPRQTKVLAELVKRLARHGTALRVRIRSHSDANRAVVADFPLPEDRKALSALFAPGR